LDWESGHDLRNGGEHLLFMPFINSHQMDRTPESNWDKDIGTHKYNNKDKKLLIKQFTKFNCNILEYLTIE
jgi:hypothetical protein